MGKSLQGKILSRTILLECGVDREPGVYAGPWFWDVFHLFFPPVTLPVSLGTTYPLFLFANPSLLALSSLLFSPDPSHPSLSSVSSLIPLLPDLSISPSLCPFH